MQNKEGCVHTNNNPWRGDKRIKALKCFPVIISVLFIISITILIVPDRNLIPTSSGATIYVPNDYPTIQDAINAAKDGDTVYVFNGIYNEDVVVNKTINLTGENRDSTKVTGSGGTNVVRISADYVNVSGFTIKSGSTTITGLVIDSDFNTIATNNFSYNWVGIYLRYSSGNNITGNIMFGDGICIIGDQLEHWNTHNIDISNTVNDKPVFYWKDQTEGVIPVDAGQVILANCTNVIVEAQAITGVSVGISLGFSSNNEIIGNVISSCIFWYGIGLYHSNRNNIIGNFVDNGRNYGLYIQHSSGNNILGNTLSSNGDSPGDYVIYLDYSEGNNITTNTFSNSLYRGIGLYYSNGNTIIGNDFQNNQHDCLYLDFSSRNNISVNTFSNATAGDGIRLINSHGNYIIDNTLTSNAGRGIWFEYSDRNYIKGNNASRNFIGIRLQYSSSNTIENNTCHRNGLQGILIEYSPVRNTVKNNTCHRNGGSNIYIRFSNETNIVGNNITHSGYYGIRIVESSGNNIIGNTIFSNAKHGIFIVGSYGNSLIRNNISFNDESGIKLEYSERHTLRDNNITNNKHGLYLYRLSHNNIITGNTISSNNNDGILLELSSNNKITDNYISDNLRGINLSFFSFPSSNNVISGNNISNNTHGIRLSSALNNAIMGNNITLNNLDGIRLFFSSDWNGIIGNTVLSNGNYGFYLNNSTNNSIYHNNIINNTNQAYDNTNNANQWDDGYPSGGNYWSDFDESSEGAYDEYNGEGQNILGSDGIVDNGTIGGGGKNPYVIDSDSQDNYPLIEPNKNFMILKQGWNLISLPLIQKEQNLTKVLKSIDGLYDAVQWYDITDARDPWKHYKVGKPYGNDLFELNEKMGIWIHITQPGDTIFFYNGTRLTENQKIALHPGWNMVGYPSLNNRDRTSALNNIDFPSDVDAIWTYDSMTQRWEKMGPSDYFEVGRGYYIHSKVTKDWDVPL
ncbi:MAG: right-handed parallel beta-helix repeat-containing protein [Thermoplasmata archaeon]|nr:MAG: right-handed parallel beta-helix repeat-containing protein [Thermoplasmata archaeon]